MSFHTLQSLLVMSFLAVAAAGCSTTVTPSESSSSGGSSGQNASGGTTSGVAAGSYSGTYQGDGTGPVRMTVTGDDIDVVVGVGGKDYAASGAISGSGGISVGIGTGDGVTVTFEGTFTSTGGSGTWKSSIATKGTWSVSK